MSNLGIFHTVVGVVAIFAGLTSFSRDGKIGNLGKSNLIYIGATLIASISAFGIFKTGKFSEAHVLTVFVLISLAAGIFLKNQIAKMLAFNLSFFFSMVPAVVETLTRVPVGNPIAEGPESPVIQGILGVLFVMLIAGSTYQIIKLRVKQPVT